MENQSCCGYKLFTAGLLADVTAVAKHTIGKINELGVNQVVTECADCYRMLKVEYPKVLNMATKDLGFEVLHIAEVADRLIKEGAIKPKKEFPEKVTYHDPCDLGRASGVYDSCTKKHHPHPENSEGEQMAATSHREIF